MRRRRTFTFLLAAVVLLLGAAPAAQGQGVLELLFGAQLLKSIFHQPSGKVEQLGMQPQLMPFFAGFAPGDPIYLRQGANQLVVPWFAAGDKDWDWVQFKMVSPSGTKYNLRRSQSEARKLAEKNGKGDEYWGFTHQFNEPGYWFIEGAGRQSGKGAMSAPTSAMVLVLTSDEYRIFSVEKARRIKAGTWNPFGDVTPDTLKGGGGEQGDQNSGNGVDAGQPTRPKLATKLATPPAAPNLYCQKAWSGSAEEYDEDLDRGVRNGRVETRYRRFLIQASVSNLTQFLEYIVYKGEKGEKEVGRVKTGKREQFALDLKLPATAGRFVIEVIAVNDRDQRSAPKRVDVTTR